MILSKKIIRNSHIKKEDVKEFLRQLKIRINITTISNIIDEMAGEKLV